MKYMTCLALWALLSFAGEAPKPVCSVRNHGQFWPAEANSSPEARRRLYQSGELEMCSAGVWKYRWEHLSVNVRALAKHKHGAAEPDKAAVQSNN